MSFSEYKNLNWYELEWVRHLEKTGTTEGIKKMKKINDERGRVIDKTITTSTLRVWQEQVEAGEVQTEYGTLVSLDWEIYSGCPVRIKAFFAESEPITFTLVGED